MTVNPSATPPPPADPATTTIPVWDAPVRIVHWAIVALMVAQIATGLAKGALLDWHMRCGEALLALVAFRILWGFVGSRNARFASFLRGPQAVLAYARSLLKRPHPQFATHNPLGGWMVVALLLALLLQAGTGLFTNDDSFVDGPLVRLVGKDRSDAISTVHRLFWWVLVGLACVHIAAALTHQFGFRENLIGAMVTGRKSLPAAETQPDHAAHAVSSSLRAVVLLGLCAIAVWWVVTRLGR
jgi:cytochrome b